MLPIIIEIIPLKAILTSVTFLLSDVFLILHSLSKMFPTKIEISPLNHFSIRNIFVVAFLSLPHYHNNQSTIHYQ